MKFKRALATAVLAGFALTSSAAAQTAVTSRAQLTTPETIDWNTVAPAFGGISNPVIISLSSTNVTVSTDGSAFNCQAGPCWSGGFTDGEGLYLNEGTYTRFLFSNAVTGLATQGHFDLGAGTVTLSAYFNNILTFTYSTGMGGGFGPNDNSATVLGVQDASGFDRLDIVGGRDFSINMVDVESAVVATPEPSSLALMATGIFALGAWRRRRSKS